MVPLYRPRRLWHVGEMEAGRRAKAGQSIEGTTGLSVSTEPDAWIQIAKLGGFPTWELTSAGGKFLHCHPLTDHQRADIHAWGLQNELCAQQTIWEVLLA